MDSPRQQTGFILRYSLQSLGIVLLLALFFRTFIFSSYVMSGSSMLPTIWPGDFLLGSKVHVRDVKRGDVVTIRCPLNKDKICLKRVIGLPGDRVEFRGDRLLLNGQLAQYHPVGDFSMEVVDGESWAIWPAKSMASGPVVVPPQNIYLLNDKRSDGDDSRSWGPVNMDILEGRVLRVWMSLDWFDGERVRVWPKIRWTRLFRSID